MDILDPNSQPPEQWRPGVRTRMRVSALTGSVQLCLFEQWCDPGKGAPTHVHAVEEVITVLDGQAEVWVGTDRATVRTGQSVVVPAGRYHGFTNTGDTVLHVAATLASSMFEASFEASNEVSRRWMPAG